MSNTGIKIGLDQDAYEALIATRMRLCSTWKCKHNLANIDGRYQCELKTIDIEDGRCMKYDAEGAG